MKVDLGIWEKLTWAATILTVCAVLALVVIKYLPLIRANEHMRQVILKNNELIAQEEERGRRLKTTIETIQHDPKTVERLARETLGYAKPGETVVRFEQPVTNSFH